ncbi:MAG: DUF2914 domain-containing protein [Desulfatiglandales bacterium]
MFERKSHDQEKAMIHRILFVLLSAPILLLWFDMDSAKGQDELPTLVHAVVCEDVTDRSPQRQGVVFSVRAGKVACYTAFDPVPRRTVIYHNWYRQDELNTTIRLVLQPPRWASYSSIQLREIDRGPWRIEIADQEGRVLHVLRFSITD